MMLHVLSMFAVAVCLDMHIVYVACACICVHGWLLTQSAGDSLHILHTSAICSSIGQYLMLYYICQYDIATGQLLCVHWMAFAPVYMHVVLTLLACCNDSAVAFRPGVHLSSQVDSLSALCK